MSYANYYCIEQTRLGLANQSAHATRVNHVLGLQKKFKHNLHFSENLYRM